MMRFRYSFLCKDLIKACKHRIAWARCQDLNLLRKSHRICCVTRQESITPLRSSPPLLWLQDQPCGGYHVAPLYITSFHMQRELSENQPNELLRWHAFRKLFARRKERTGRNTQCCDPTNVMVGMVGQLCIKT